MSRAPTLTMARIPLEMRPSRRTSSALGAACLVLVSTTADATVERSRGEIVMGTVLQVTVADDDPESAQRYAARAIAIARRWDDVLTTWRQEGELARLNAAAGHGPVAISAQLYSALAQMRRLSDITDGAFDPGVGPLVRYYARSRTDITAPPTAHTRIARVLRLQGGSAELASGSSLDAGGIGKGIALDAMAEELRNQVQGAYFNFGGSSQLAFGTRADGRPWAIALSGLDGRRIHGFVHLEGALSTSRARPIGDESGPIVDPVSGSVVSKDRLVTCLAASASTAEAWSTALVVRGEQGLPSALASGVEVLYEQPGSLWLSNGLRALVSTPRAP